MGMCYGSGPSHVCHRPPRIEAVVSVDERGQIVLPKEIREKARLRPKDKLALIAHYHGDEIAYIMLIPVDRLAENLRRFLGSLLSELLAPSEERPGQEKAEGEG